MLNNSSRSDRGQRNSVKTTKGPLWRETKTGLIYWRPHGEVHCKHSRSWKQTVLVGISESSGLKWRFWENISFLKMLSCFCYVKLPSNYWKANGYVMTWGAFTKTIITDSKIPKPFPDFSFELLKFNWSWTGEIQTVKPKIKIVKLGHTEVNQSSLGRRLSFESFVCCLKTSGGGSIFVWQLLYSF